MGPFVELSPIYKDMGVTEEYRCQTGIEDTVQSAQVRIDQKSILDSDLAIALTSNGPWPVRDLYNPESLQGETPPV